MSERRTARRYDLSLPVMIRVPVEKEISSRNGKTRDISTRGVYFLVDNNLNAGSELDLTMTLPAEITGGTEVFIRAIGKVVRVENRPETGEQRIGVAAVIERYEIIRSEMAS
jgi:c-di-GMP-binding flagellar brake protein YcgR